MSTTVNLLNASKKTLDGVQSLSPGGLDLTLEPWDGKEAEQISLTLVGDSAALTLNGANITTNKGELGSSWPDTVNWVIVDWLEPRAICSIDVEKEGNENFKVRVKIFAKGAWVPMYPIDVFEIGKHNFPPVVASKLMLEPVDVGNGVYDSTASPISNVTIEYTNQPFGVVLSIGDAAPFFVYGDTLPGGVGVTTPDFSGEVNAYLANHPASSIVPLQIKATTGGNLKLSALVETFDVKSAVHNRRADNTLHLCWEDEDEASGSIHIAGNEVREINFKPRLNIADEQLLWRTPNSSRRAMLCKTDVSIAQGFKALPPGAVLQGLDIFVRGVFVPANKGEKSPERIQGVLSLHGNDKGKPVQQAIEGAIAEFELVANSAAASMDAQWLSLNFASLQCLSAGPWWAVITLHTPGEVLWYCCDTAEAADITEDAKEPARPNQLGPCLYRPAPSAWLESSAGPALTRVRVQDNSTKSLQLRLRRGESEVAVIPDNTGRVHLANAAALAPLNRDLEVENLDIVIAPHSRSFDALIAASVELKDLRIVTKKTD